MPEITPTRWPFTLLVKHKVTGKETAMPAMCANRDLAKATAELTEMFDGGSYTVSHVAPRESADLARAGLCDWNE